MGVLIPFIGIVALLALASKIKRQKNELPYSSPIPDTINVKQDGTLTKDGRPVSKGTILVKSKRPSPSRPADDIVREIKNLENLDKEAAPDTYERTSRSSAQDSPYSKIKSTLDYVSDKGFIKNDPFSTDSGGTHDTVSIPKEKLVPMQYLDHSKLPYPSGKVVRRSLIRTPAQALNYAETGFHMSVNQASKGVSVETWANAAKSYYSAARLAAAAVKYGQSDIKDIITLLERADLSASRAKKA